MTDEFAKTVNKLARARNFEDGSYLLLTKNGDENYVAEMKGAMATIVCGIGGVVKNILESSDDNEARAICEHLKKIIIADEERRFQQRGASE